MVMVGVEESFMNFFVWGFLASILTIIGIIVMVLVRDVWRTPKESKKLRSATNQKKAVNLLVGDDGIGDIVVWDKIGHEGAALTNLGGKPKSHWTGIFSRASKIPEIECAKDKDVQVTQGIAQYVSNLSSQKTILRGARIPITVAYKGKAVVATILGLASLGILEKLDKYATLKAEDAKAKAEEIVKDFQESFVKVDVAGIKNLFSESWNESQVNANEEDWHQAGIKEGRKNQPNPIIMVLLAMGFCFGCGILLVVVMKIL